MAIDLKNKIYDLLQWSILAVAFSYFLFPYFPRQSFHLFGKSFFITQPLMLVSVVLFFMALFFSSELKERLWSILKLWRINLPLVVSMIVIVLSTFAALGFGVQTLSRVLSIVAILLIFALFSLLSERFIDRLLILSAWFTIASSFLGILQFFGGRAFSPAFYLTGRGEALAVGFAKHSSLFGLQLSAFLLIFWLLFILNYKGRKNLWGFAFFFGVPALVLAFSRGAWLAVFVAGIMSLAWLVVEHREKTVTALKSLGVSLIIALITLVLGISYPIPKPEGVTEKGYSPNIVEERFSVEDKSTFSKILFHQAAFDMVLENPKSFLFGLGQWGFYDAWSQYDPRPDLKIRGNTDPHSTFLEILTAGGILAFLFFVVFLWFLYKIAWEKRDKNTLIVPFLLAFSAIIVNGLTHTHLYTKYMWIVAGITISLLALKEENKKLI